MSAAWVAFYCGTVVGVPGGFMLCAWLTAGVRADEYSRGRRAGMVQRDRDHTRASLPIAKNTDGAALPDFEDALEVARMAEWGGER